MKNYLCLLILLFIFTPYFSQKKVKEVGLNFYNFQNYGMFYKVGNGESMWRFRVLNGAIGFSESVNSRNITTNNFYLNITASAGREKRKEITPKLSFVSGIELLTSINYTAQMGTSSARSSRSRLGIGIGGVFGLRHEFNKRFFAGAEILPNLMYQASNSSSQRLFNLNMQFSASALLCFGIKF